MRITLTIGIIALFSAFLLGATPVTGVLDPLSETGAQGLQLALDAGGLNQEIGRWSLGELQSRFKKNSLMERTPADSTSARWTGVLVQELIEKAIHSLPVDAKASIDLVILKNNRGETALVPRAVITKYPLLLAFQREKNNLKELHSIVPWGSRPKVLEESLPLARYFVEGVTRIELANYREKYSALFLRRRTDPAAMRGEKLFVQSCVGCHGAGMGPAITEFHNESRMRSLASTGHPEVKGNPKLTDRDHRAIMSYLDAYRSENPPAVSAATEGSRGQTATW